jgi:hypothetical protein
MLRQTGSQIRLLDAAEFGERRDDRQGHLRIIGEVPRGRWQLASGDVRWRVLGRKKTLTERIAYRQALERLHSAGQ